MEEDMYTKEDLSHFDKAVKAISGNDGGSDPDQQLKKEKDIDNPIL